MKVLFVTNSFLPNIGGVEKHIYYLIKELKTLGVYSEVLTFGEDNNEYKIEDIDVKCLKKTNKLKQLLRQWNLISYYKSFDIIHFHDFSTYYLFYILARFVLPGKKTYVTFHGWEGKYPIPKSIRKQRKIVEKLTEGNICVGQFIEKYYETKADIINYGAAPELIIKDSQIDNLDILFLGRLEIDSGFSFFIDAMSKLENINIGICGDGSLKDRILEIENKHNVKYYGKIPNPQDYIAKAKTVFTGGYLAYIECLSLRKSIITTYDNALKKDYINCFPDKEYITVVNNYEDLKCTIANNMKNIDEISEDYSIYIKNKYSWSNIARDYLKLWDV